MSRSRAEQFEAPGKDSFLDVVANVVAILIILVIVVGSQASKAAVQKETARLAAQASGGGAGQAEAGSVASEAKALESGIQDLQSTIDRQKLEVAFRRAERDRVQLLVAAAERRLAEHREQLSAAEKERYDLDAELIASRGELTSLAQAEARPGKPPRIVLQHLPTPMAKTVFGDEVHFRLQGHRLAYLPWDEMMAQLKADAPNQVHKLRSQPRVEVSLPPISGFGARYALKVATQEMQTRLGVATQSQVVLDRIFFVDAEPNLGQPAAEAFAPTSEFRSRLAGHKPQATTITIWVYSDSFDDYRALKAELFKLGYLCAARPMPDGHPIGAAPDGTRSSAE
ncbi:MAG TPA: hypothetical protein VFB80_12820 [Pirellulaceae bacterium]|nr:hypothetical protein [Pirellulaceae bacterium]